MNSAGHGTSIERITYTKGRLEVSVCYAGLGALGDEIEDGSASSLRTGASGGRDGNERLESAWNGLTFAQWRIDKVEELGICLTCQMVGADATRDVEAYRGKKCTDSSALPCP